MKKNEFTVEQLKVVLSSLQEIAHLVYELPDEHFPTKVAVLALVRTVLKTLSNDGTIEDEDDAVGYIGSIIEQFED